MKSIIFFFIVHFFLYWRPCVMRPRWTSRDQEIAGRLYNLTVSVIVSVGFITGWAPTETVLYNLALASVFIPVYVYLNHRINKPTKEIDD